VDGLQGIGCVGTSGEARKGRTEGKQEEAMRESGSSAQVISPRAKTVTPGQGSQARNVEYCRPCGRAETRTHSRLEHHTGRGSPG